MQRTTILSVPRRCFLYVIAVALISAAPVGAVSLQPVTKFVPYEYTAHFGSLMSLDGDTALVGSYEYFCCGMDFYVYKRDSSGHWAESATLSNERHIDSVSLKNGLLLTGATGISAGSATAGRATISRDNGDGSWTREAAFVGRSVLAHDGFGSSVTIDGGVAVVGAPFSYLGPHATYNAGAAYVFERSPAGRWTETAKLVASDSFGFKQFGHTTSISGDSILISSPGGGSIYPGSAYVFGRNASGGWDEVQKLLPSDSVLNNFFGISAALDGDTAIIGATDHHHEGRVPGAAYIFRDDGTGTWSEVAKLTVPASFSGSLFGLSVSIFGNYAVVGSPDVDWAGGDGTEPGLAFVFKERPTGAWELEFVLSAPDGAAGDGFGRDVAISGRTIAVGAPFEDGEQVSARGSVYMFEIPEPSAAPLAMLSLVGVFRRSPKRRHAVLIRVTTK